MYNIQTLRRYGFQKKLTVKKIKHSKKKYMHSIPYLCGNDYNRETSPKYGLRNIERHGRWNNAWLILYEKDELLQMVTIAIASYS